MIYIHLGIASLFLPLLLLMPFSGTAYLWGFKGQETKTEAFRIQGVAPTDEKEKEEFFRNQFKQQNISFDFEYVKTNPSDFIFRPATRDYYTADVKDGEIIFYSVKPNLLKRLIELHKGHGPKLMKAFESAFGISLILVTLSGLWLSITVPAYRKVTLVSFGAGVLIIALCLI